MDNTIIANMQSKYFIITLVNSELENEIVNAMVLAKSIRKQNVISNIIAFITSRKQKSIDLLKYFYDDVIILENPTANIFKHSQLNSAEKTLFIHCNSIVLKNISNIFNLKNNAILYDSDDSKLLHYKYQNKQTNEIQQFNDIKFAIDLKDSYNNYDIVFFNLFQPSILENNINIEERSNYPILIFWFYLYRGILNVNPELYDNKILKETNEILTYYFIQLSNLTPNINKSFKQTNCNAVNEIFNINMNKNCQLYHLDYSKEYESFEINYTIPVENTTVIITIDEEIPKSITKSRNNIILSYKLNQQEIKNLLFKINTHYTYSERSDYLNKLYGIEKNDKTYSLKLIIYKTLFANDIEHMDNKIMFFTNSYDKIKVLSLLLNQKSYSLLNTINFIDIHKMDNFKNVLKYQSVKKWIYSMFNGNEIENMIIVKLDFTNFEKVIIINNNDVSVVNIKKITSKKIEFLDIIFAKSGLYNDILNEYVDIVSKINDSNKYYLFDGLKVEKINY